MSFINGLVNFGKKLVDDTEGAIGVGNGQQTFHTNMPAPTPPPQTQAPQQAGPLLNRPTIAGQINFSQPQGIQLNPTAPKPITFSPPPTSGSNLPNVGDVAGLSKALNGLPGFSQDDQIRLINRAANTQLDPNNPHSTLLPRNVAAAYINQIGSPIQDTDRSKLGVLAQSIEQNAPLGLNVAANFAKQVGTNLAAGNLYDKQLNGKLDGGLVRSTIDQANADNGGLVRPNAQGLNLPHLALETGIGAASAGLGAAGPIFSKAADYGAGALLPNAAARTIGAARLGLNQVANPVIDNTSGVLAGTIGGALNNAAFNASSAATQGANLGQIASAAKSGLKQGAAFGAAGELVGRASQAYKPASAMAAEAASKSTGLSPNNIINDNEAGTLRDFADYKMGSYRPDATTTNQLLMQARNAAKTAGVDVTSGSPRDIATRIENYISQRNSFLQMQNSILQGGYARLPGGEGKVSFDVNTENGLFEPKVSNPEEAANIAETMNGYQPKGRVIIKETAPRNGRSDAIALTRNAETGKLEGQQLSIEQPRKTGVKDSQLDTLNTVRKQIIRAEADNIMAAHDTSNVVNVRKLVRDRGGISSSAYEDVPSSVKNKNGIGADKMAQELGYPDEDTLIADLQKEPQPKLTRSQAEEMAIENLENGRSQYADDWNEIKQSIGQRQDELSLYPNGKYRQVKINNGLPSRMSDEEFASLVQSSPESRENPHPGKVNQRNDKIAIRNADAERQVLDNIKNGETSDRVLYDYMKATGTDLQTATRDVQRVLSESGMEQQVNNPLRGTVDIPKANDAGQAHLNGEYVTGQLNDALNLARATVEKMSDHDIELLKDIETAPVEIVAQRADNPAAFTDAVNQLRRYYDLRDAWDNRLGIDHGYRFNYLRQLVENTDQPDTLKARGGNERPGYTKARSNETLRTNVLDALDREGGAVHNLGKLAYEEGLTDVYGDKIAKGEIMRGDTGTYQQLKTKYGNDLTAPKEISEKINGRAQAGVTTNKAIRIYDKTNANLKYLKLGGGLFHMTTEGMNFLGHQLASGKILLNPGATARTLSSTISKRIAENSFTHFEENGTLNKARLGGVKYMPKEILADTNSSIVDKLKRSNPITKFIGSIHDAVFQREIPIAKLTIFEQATKDLDINNPADLAKIRQAGNAVNHIFGGLNREVDTHVLSPEAAKMASRLFLATDFTEAKFNTLRDALTNPGLQGNIARQAVIGKTLVAAIPGLITATAAGTINWNDPKDVAKHIADQILDPHFDTPFKTKSGIHKIAKTPETFISELGRLITPMFADGPNKKQAELDALQHYITARTSSAASTIFQLATNKDYKGDPIIVRDANGKINIGKSAANVALLASPIPISEGAKVGEHKETGAEAALNIAGFRTKADPNDPKMKAFNYQNQVVNGLTPQDKAAWNVAHGKVTDQYGNVKNTVTPADLLNRYTTELANPAVLAADKMINDYKKSQGQPGDPFYDLTPEQQHTLLVYQTLKNIDRGDNSGTATVLYDRNKDWINQYNQARSAYFNQLNLPPSTKQRLIDEPNVTPEVQQALDGARGLQGQDYVNYMSAHPELQQYYSQLDATVRAQRNYYNEPQFKDYPTPSDRVTALLNQARGMGKSPARTAIFKDPEVSNFLADIAMWQLNQGAAKARFQGNDYTQKDLKNIYSIGNYDIARLPNGMYAQIAGTLSNGQGLSGSGITTGGVTGFNANGGMSSAQAGAKGYGKKAKRIYFKRRKVSKVHIGHARKLGHPYQIHLKTHTPHIRNKSITITPKRISEADLETS